MISAALKKAVGAVRQNEQPRVVPGFLRPIDIDRVAANLNIDSLAVERAKKELPPADAPNPDVIEQQITAASESEWAWQAEEFVNNLRAYGSRISDYSVEAEAAQLRLRSDNSLADLRTAATRAPAELGPLQNAYIAAREELSAFRTKHRLVRPARNTTGRATTLGLLFVVIAVESVLNGFFFAKGAQLGLVGGVGTAIGVSVVNILTAFLLGVGPARWISHRNWLLKFVSFVFLIAGACGLTLVHAFASHFRDATARVGEELAFGEALKLLQQQGVLFSDLMSYYLFGLGLLLGLLAFLKGRSFDDPYPEYGAVWRRHEHAQDAYSDVHADFFDELEGIKGSVVEELRAGIANIPAYPQMAESIRLERKALTESFRGYESSLETSTNALLERYRDRNKSYRQTPVPAYFNSRWKLRRSILDSPEVKSLLSDEKSKQPADIDAILNDLNTRAEALLAEYESLAKRYPHPTQMQ